MIAAAILLNGHLTLRTVLRVGGDPVEGLTIVGALFLPLLQQVAL